MKSRKFGEFLSTSEADNEFTWPPLAPVEVQEKRHCFSCSMIYVKAGPLIWKSLEFISEFSRVLNILTGIYIHSGVHLGRKFCPCLSTKLG